MFGSCEPFAQAGHDMPPPGLRRIMLVGRAVGRLIFEAVESFQFSDQLF